MLYHVTWICTLLYLTVCVTAAASAKKENCGKHKHGDNWDHETLSCMTYRCRDGVVYPKYTGCIYNEKCYKINQKWSNDCTFFTCISYKEGNKTYFETKVDMKCTVGNKCKSHGQQWKEGCAVKNCTISSYPGSDGRATYSAMMHTVKNGCRVGKKCYNHGQRWRSKCTWYTCEVTDAYTKAVGVPGCQFKKKCYPIGRFRSYKDKQACYKYVCEKKGETVGWKMVTAECRYKNKCKPHKSTWRVEKDCMEMTCLSSPNSQGTQTLTVKEKVYGCADGKKCRNFMSTWEDKNCSVYKCSLVEGAASLRVIKTKCKDRFGKCRDWNSGPFEGKIKKGKKSAIFKNCKCERVGDTGSKMTCTREQF